MQFKCRLGTPEGQILEEVHEAENLGLLKEDLKRKGFHLFSAKPKGAILSALFQRNSRKKRIPLQEFMIFNQEFAALLKAGLPLLQVLDLMIERIKDAAFKVTMLDVRSRIESGEELSDAFSAQGRVFPPLFASSLKAGERSGDLEKVIRRFIRYMELILTAKKRVVSALVYPVVLVVLSMIMIGVMAIYVVPKFSVFYEDMDAELPWITQIVLSSSFVIRDNWIAILVGIAVAIVFFLRWRRTTTGILTIHRLQLQIPLLGGVFRRFSGAEFCRSLATLLDGGMPLVPSLEIAVSSVGNQFVKGRMEPVVQKVREGQSLYASVEETEMLDDIAIDLIRVGEATGSLGSMLTTVSDFLDQEVEIKVQRLLTLIEPIMLVFMGLIVAILLVSVYLPMFSALGQIRA